MTARGSARGVRLAACGLVLLVAGWGATETSAEAAGPALPAPTTVAPDPPPRVASTGQLRGYDRPSEPVRPVVTIEMVRSVDEPSSRRRLLFGAAFLAGLLVPLVLLAAVLLVHRRRLSLARDPVTREAVAPPRHLPPAQPPAKPVAPEPEPPPIEPPRFDQPERQPVPEQQVAMPAERAEWEYCEVDWWRGYVKSTFFAKAATPAGSEYIVDESPMFRWRGNGLPQATPASVAAYDQLIEKLRAEGWEEDPEGQSSTWFAQTFRRRPDALSR